MKKIGFVIFWSFVLCLLPTGRAGAQHRPADEKGKTGINLSLWKGISTQRNDSVGQTVLNIGIVSTQNRLNGIGVNLLGALTRRDANGMMLSGIAQIVPGSLNGIGLTGLVGIYGERVNGMTVTGLVNMLGEDTNGVGVSGLLNISGAHANGLQLAGLGNITGEDFRGVSIGGFINVAGNRMQGVQLAGIMNIASDGQGLQLAPVNVVAKGKGVQLGLVNYYREQFDGIQLGLVNANANTRIQLMAFGGNRAKLNLAARFKNERFYTILGIGSPYLNFNDKFSGSLYYRAGIEIPVYKKLYLSGDVGYQHIETFSNRHHGTPARFYALQARLNVELRATEQLGYFISSGYSHERRYGHASPYMQKPVIEGGIIIYHF